MKKNKEFLYEYLNAYSPAGQEEEGQEIWRNYIEDHVDVIKTDAYGTSYGIKRTKTENPLKVVIEAHCDEIAWIITNIEADGMIRVKRHGGSDNMIAPSKTVMIHTHTGTKVKGLFGWPAIHTRSAGTIKGYEPHELWVDTGLKDLAAVNKAGVEVGNLITFDDQFHEMGDYYVGRSLDNKIGGYIIAEALREISEKKYELPFDLYVVNSVQEEVGLFGAKKIAKHLQADLALVHDVCHSFSLKMDAAKDGSMLAGKGPAIEYTPQNHRGINKLLREVADKNKIPLQLIVGSTGNDTIAFFLENTITAILATPLKYMHSTVEMAAKKDVKRAIKIFVEFLLELTPDKINALNNR